MKSEQLFELLGELDEEFVEAARKKKRMNWKRWGGLGAMAACLCLICVAAFYTPDGETIGAEPHAQTVIIDLERPILEAGQEEIGIGTSIDEPGVETVIDVPAQENPIATGTLEIYESVWGGSYTDASGMMYVLLTEDTPEIRDLVYRRNPSMTEENTVFLKAEYTQTYLDTLLMKISDLMAAGELPCVTTAARLDDRNCIKVTMTREDPESMELIQRLDTQGGAVEFVISDGQSVHDVAVIEVDQMA